MKKITLPVLIFLSIPLVICAQKRTEDFQLNLPEKKVQNSLYSSIRFIDAREDTALVGIINRGVFNDRVTLITKQPLKDQISSVFTALIDGSAKNGELVLHVRQFIMAEVHNGSLTGKGYCYMRANLFAGNNGIYRQLKSFDSVVAVKSTYDVTEDVLKTGSEVMTSFIASNLSKEPVGTEVYSLDDIYKIERFEKRNMAVYQADVYKDGVYRSFRSFVDQTPDGQITAKVKKNEIWDIFTFNKKGKKEKVWQKDTYAVIYNGMPYISTEFDYYPLHKQYGDFCFTGKARAFVFSADAIVTSTLFLVLLGGLLMPFYGEATFEMKIDHLNGGFIRLRQIKK